MTRIIIALMTWLALTGAAMAQCSSTNPAACGTPSIGGAYVGGPLTSVLNLGSLAGTWGGSPTFSGAPVISGGNTVATGSTTPRSFAARFSERLNIRDGCGAAGAVGDGVTDDSAAIAACITLANTLAASGGKPVVYVPGGVYLIKGTAMPTAGYGVGIVGDGEHQTYFQIDPTYQGTQGAIFGWHNAWMASAYPQQYGGTINIANDTAGPLAQDFTIVGNTTSPNEQDAFTFFGYNDHIDMHDVDVFFLNGQCIRTGKEYSGDAASYTRESVFRNIFCWSTGTSSLAAVDFANVGSFSGTGDIRIDDLNIFASGGIGLSLRAPASTNSIGHMMFSNLRVEQSGADNFHISEPGDAGIVGSVYISNMYLISPGAFNAGHYSLWMGAGTNQDYDIGIVNSSIGNCDGSTNCYGIKIDNVRVAHIGIINNAANSNAVVYTSNTNSNVIYDAQGYNPSTFVTTGAVLGNITSPLYEGMLYYVK